MQTLVYYNKDEMGERERESEKEDIDNLYKNYNKEIDKMDIAQSMPIVDLKRKTRKGTAGFNMQKTEGKLMAHNIESVKPSVDQFDTRQYQFDNRQFQPKFNKLSTILLSRSVDPSKRKGDNNNEYEASRSFRENIKDIERKNYAITKSPQQKFIRITMAMLSSKGPNCEDRVITRLMRTDKGGVVDLAQSTHKTKKFEIKKINKRSPHKKEQAPRSMKDRLLASKLIQKWWRDILNKYKHLTDKIIKLQSAWRGYWVRTYLYEIVYFSILSQAFIDKFKPPVVNHVRKEIFPLLSELFADKYRKRLNFEKILKK